MIQEISTEDELRAIADEWWDLWNRVRATTFQSPAWLLPWWRHLFRGGEMWTIAVRSNGRLTGLAPLFIYGDRRVAFIGSGVSDYLQFLAEDEEVSRQIWSAIASAQDRWQVCDLQEIPPGSLTPSGSQMAIAACPSSVCPVVPLPESIWEFEAKLSPKFRHHLRNSRNRLADLGASFESGCGSEFVGALMRCHSERWESKGAPGVLSDPAVQAFFREACAELHGQGCLRFHSLRWRDHLAAIVCIFCAHGRHAYYLGGFSGELSRYSPGSALVHFAIQRAIEEGAAEFDFLRNGEGYKYRWGAVDRPTERLVVTSASVGRKNRQDDVRKFAVSAE